MMVSIYELTKSDATRSPLSNLWHYQRVMSQVLYLLMIHLKRQFIQVSYWTIRSGCHHTWGTKKTASNSLQATTTVFGKRLKMYGYICSYPLSSEGRPRLVQSFFQVRVHAAHHLRSTCYCIVINTISEGKCASANVQYCGSLKNRG